MTDSVPPGLAYLLRTGRPADGSSGDNTESTQHLVNPPVHNPTANPAVHAWVRQRARDDLALQQAAAHRRQAPA